MLRLCLMLALVLQPCFALFQRSASQASTATGCRLALKDELTAFLAPLDLGLKASKRDREAVQQMIAALTDPQITKKLATMKNPAGAFRSDRRGKGPSPLFGRWDLLYTDAPDVLNIGQIPGVDLKYVGQDVTRENTILNLVQARAVILDTTQEVIVGAVQESPSRVGLRFESTRINFDSLFGATTVPIIKRPLTDLLKPIEVKFDQEKFSRFIEKEKRLQPYFDILYLDDTLRIQKTPEGFTFVLQKNVPVGATKTSGNVGAKRPEASSPASIQSGSLSSSSPSGLALGPWMQRTLGEKGMKAIGIVSVVPYALFFYKFVEKLLATVGNN